MWAKQINFGRSPRRVHFTHQDLTDAPDCQSLEDAPSRSDEAAENSRGLSEEPTTTETNDPISACAYRQLCLELESFKTQQQQWLGELQHATIELATLLCRKLMLEGIADGRQQIEALVRQAVGHFDQSAALRVHLHPNDWKRLADTNPDFAASPQLSFIEDEAVARGNCRVASSEFALSFDWQARLEDLRSSLIQSVNDAGIEP